MTKIQTHALGLLLSCGLMLGFAGCGMLGTPAEVQTAHREAALDAKAIFEAYLIQLRAIVPADAAQAAEKERLIGLVEANARRFFEKQESVGRYLAAPPIFANDQERQDFLALIRAARGDS